MSTSPPKIYAIPGLGMRHGIFERLQLDLGPILPVDWVEPLSPKEPFDDYCLRLTEQMDLSAPIVLIGMSLGGMAAVRLARYISIGQFFLISSVKQTQEKPEWLSWFRRFPIYKLHTTWGRNQTAKLWTPRFGLDTDEYRSLCLPMMASHSIAYWNWAVSHVVSWENESYPAHLVHFHGNKDQIMPEKYVGPHVRIAGGDHFMVYKQAEELSDHMNAILAERGIGV